MTTQRNCLVVLGLLNSFIALGAGPMAATKDVPWSNSLGMAFVPVPKTKVLFCIWETRVKDFDVFARASGYHATNGMHPRRSDSSNDRGDTWKSPGFTQGEAHPVVNVSWGDAQAFCRWLTERERKAGMIGASDQYRLPTDAEWSRAVGIGDLEGNGTPKEKNGKIKGAYPWGKQWPPPAGAGNYAQPMNVDDFKNTTPAGSFKPNQLGIYDLGGNVWEWCEDYFDGQSGWRVLRGASWHNGGPDYLLSSCRNCNIPDYRVNRCGFRVVLVVGSAR